jgi:GLPGLI family protein
MKLIFLFLLSIIIAKADYAQEPEKPIISVHYNFIHLIDTTKPDIPYENEEILYIGGKTSLYTSYSVLLSERRMEVFMLRYPGQKFGGLYTINFAAPFSFYKKITGDILQTRTRFWGNDYLTEEAIPKFDWEISSELKTIGGYRCQRATTRFRGRTYEAWFCDKLPFSNGPWKLGGLPGLILEASDEKKEVIFTFKSFGDSTELQMPFKLTGDMIKTTVKELNHATSQYQSGRPANGESAMDNRNNGGGGGKIDFQAVDRYSLRPYNNPIEKAF